jgi:hypothetical protein
MRRSCFQSFMEKEWSFQCSGIDSLLMQQQMDLMMHSVKMVHQNHQCLQTQKALILANNIGDMQLQVILCNNTAMSAFTLAFKTQSLHATTCDVMTMDWPKGLASLVVRALLDEYSPSDTVAGVEAAAMLDKVKWKADQSPMKIFAQLATIKNMFPEKVTEEQFITTMMAKAPKDYKTIITMESRSVCARLNGEPNLQEYKKAMIEHFCTLGGDADLDADGKEVLLAAVDAQLWQEGSSCQGLPKTQERRRQVAQEEQWQE